MICRGYRPSHTLFHGLAPRYLFPQRVVGYRPTYHCHHPTGDLTGLKDTYPLSFKLTVIGRPHSPIVL